MTPPRTLEEARALAVDRILAEQYARELAALSPSQRERFARVIAAEDRRAAFYVVRGGRS